MGLLLVIVLVLLLMGSFPTWGHSRSWGYRPTGILGLLLLVVIVLALMQTIPMYGMRRTVVVTRPGPVVIEKQPVTIVKPVVVDPSPRTEGRPEP